MHVLQKYISLRKFDQLFMKKTKIVNDTMRIVRLVEIKFIIELTNLKFFC